MARRVINGESGDSNGKRAANLAATKATAATTQAIKALRSELIERFQFATGEHGISFSGARDLYGAGGYPRKLTSKHYSDLYERGDIAERLVEAYPKATWSPGTSIFEDEDPDNVTDWETRINNDSFSKHDVWNVFKRADILSRLGEHGYSVILIGDKSRTPLNEELPTSIDTDSIIYLQPLHERNAKIIEFDEDLYSPRFSLPLIYELNLGKSKNQGVRKPKVHWSRLIHFTEGGLDNPVYGPPALRSIFNRLYDMEKIYTAGSEAAYKRMDPGVALSTKENAELGANEEEIKEAVNDLREEMNQFFHGLERHVLLNNMDVTPLNTPVHNFGPNIDSLLKVIAGAKAFPQRKLTGSEEAQLASEQDRSSWQDAVAERRLNVAEPHVRAFVNRISKDNPDEWEIYWPDKGELNLHEKAELVERLARANQAQYQADGTIIVTNDEIRDLIDFGPLEDVVEVEEDDPTMSENLRRRIREQSVKSKPVAGLLTRKREHVARKMKARGVVLVNPRDARNLAPATDRDEQTAVRRIADYSRSSFANAMLSVWSSTFTDDDSEMLRLSLDNLERAESFAMSKIYEMESLLTTTITDRLTSIMERSAKSSLRVVANRGSWSTRRKVGRFEAVSYNSDRNPTARDSDNRGVREKSQLKSIMDFNIANPRAIAWARERSSQLITEIGSSTREAVKSIISDGIREGRAPRVIAKEIRERVGLRSDQLETLARFKLSGATESQVERRAKQLLKQRAELIARTETMRSSNEGLKELWRQAQDNDLLPKDVKREWIATTGDDRTRDEHLDLDGEQVGVDEQFSLGFEPGEEPSCFLPGTRVSGAFVAGLKARYSGPARVIKTSRGFSLSLTINHPVLTSAGWKPAWELNEGDNLIAYSAQIRNTFGARNPDHKNSEPVIEEVFQSISLRGLSSVQSRSHHLHGDARWLEDANIDVVRTDRKLLLDTDSFASDRSSNLVLPISDMSLAKSLVASSSPAELFVERDFSSYSRKPGGTTLANNLSSVLLEACPFEVFSFGPAANLDVVKPESSPQGGTTDAGFIAELLERGTGLIALDQIVEIEDFHFRGHVYDLQSVTGWMIAQGIVTSNCRCSQGIA